MWEKQSKNKTKPLVKLQIASKDLYRAAADVELRRNVQFPLEKKDWNFEPTRKHLKISPNETQPPMYSWLATIKCNYRNVYLS